MYSSYILGDMSHVLFLKGFSYSPESLYWTSCEIKYKKVKWSYKSNKLVNWKSGMCCKNSGYNCKNLLSLSFV